MTTTPTEFPNVPLPAGAYVASDFPFWGGECRVVSGRDRGITGADGIVYTSAVQLRDGSLDQSPTDGPHVYINEGAVPGHGLTSDQARELAALLIEAADQVNGWTATAPDANEALAAAWAATERAYSALRMTPGNGGDYLRAALDSITDAIEVTR